MIQTKEEMFLAEMGINAQATIEGDYTATYKLKDLLKEYAEQRIIAYTNWLSKQNLMICEGVDGHTFRSSMIGGKKYTAEELYDKFISEYVA